MLQAHCQEHSTGAYVDTESAGMGMESAGQVDLLSQVLSA